MSNMHSFTAQTAYHDLLNDLLARDRPGELLEALEDARSRGLKWRSKIEASLKRLPDSARFPTSLDLN